jgi:hypothetical protein
MHCGRRSLPMLHFLDNASAAKGIFKPIWSVVGPGLISRFLSKLASDETIKIGDVAVNRDGVMVDGNWRILFLKAKPRFVPWTDVKISSGSGLLLLESISDVRFRSEIRINDTENAIVLDGAIRALLHNNNWKRLGKVSP